MNILNKVTWKAMWKNKTRTIVTIIGIILSASMFMAVTTAAFSALDFVIRGYADSYGDYFIGFDRVTDEQYSDLEANKSVSQIADYKVLGLVGLVENSHSDTGFSEEMYVAAVNKTFLEAMPVHLVEGRMPENSSEILVPERYMELYRLKNIPVSIGDTVTHLIQTRLSDTPDPLLYNDYPYAQWEASFTVVGVYENYRFSVTNQNLPSMLTLDDGRQHDHLYHRVFLRTAPAGAVYDLEEAGYGEEASINNVYLRLFGASRYENINAMLCGIVAVLLAIIMIASVSLIGNAFAISVSERTKQFGLLSSVGATRKQIRRSVLLEAGAVCLFGVPLGLAAGYLGMSAVLVSMRPVFQSFFAFDSSIAMEAVLSLPAVLIAGAVCVLTVYISAWIPSRRAAGVSAIEAIRQSPDYQVGSKPIKTGKLTGSLFGLPGLLSRKYYKTSQRKYRATTVSLAFSLVLFVAASFFCTNLTASAERSIATHNFDFLLEAEGAEGAAILEQIRNMPEVSRSVYRDGSAYDAVVATGDYTEGYLHVVQTIADEYEGGFVAGKYDAASVSVHYIEDDSFFQYLKDNGLDVQKYQDPEHPTALVLVKDYHAAPVRNDKGELVRYTYYGSPVKDSLMSVELTQIHVSNAPYFTDAAGVDYRVLVSDEGIVYLQLQGMYANSEGMVGPSGEVKYVAVLSEENENGVRVNNYYDYDPVSKEIGKTVLDTDAQTVNLSVRLGDRVEVLPFGVEAFGSNIYLVLPLSAQPEIERKDVPMMAIQVEDYLLVLDALQPYDGNGLFVYDYMADEVNTRGILLLVKLLSYGFTLLIAMISIANVFNTVTTNIALRRRDFGMLRSIGMQTGELYRMMVYECLLYGGKAVLWGLPISFLLSYGIFRVFASTFETDFVPPWGAALIAGACIFLTVFLSMFYAVTKLRRDNPIEAIRTELT